MPKKNNEEPRSVATGECHAGHEEPPRDDWMEYLELTTAIAGRFGVMSWADAEWMLDLADVCLSIREVRVATYCMAPLAGGHLAVDLREVLHAEDFLQAHGTDLPDREFRAVAGLVASWVGFGPNSYDTVLVPVNLDERVELMDALVWVGWDSWDEAAAHARSIAISLEASERAAGRPAPSLTGDMELSRDLAFTLTGANAALGAERDRLLALPQGQRRGDPSVHPAQVLVALALDRQ